MRRPPKYLLSMALSVLPANEQEDSLQDHERDVIASKESLRKKLFQDPTAEKPCAQVGRMRKTLTKRGQRLCDGRAVVDYLRASGIDPHDKLPSGTWRRWATSVGRTAHWWTKTKHMYFTRALRAHLESEYQPVTDGARYRALGTQGRPRKTTEIREQLFHWFCDQRRHVKGRLPLSSLWREASRLRDVYVLECLRQKVQPDAPVINYQWLAGWRKEYNVSLRFPNKRWKVPRPVLSQRMRIMWENIFRIQTLIKLHFNRVADLDGFDQKPLHCHESGSKNLKTLAFRGELEVPVKEGHSATRSRWTATTYVSSNLSRARAILPLELCFKGGSGVNAELGHMCESLRASGSAGDWLSLIATESASYKADDVLDYLKTVLEEWTPSRSRGDDYRILPSFCL